MSDNNNGYAMLGDIFREQNEERRLREAEAQVRYASRRAEKMDQRKQIEKTAKKVLTLVDAAADNKDLTPMEIGTLASTLSMTVAALHAAEQYAEIQPYAGVGLGFCAG